MEAAGLQRILTICRNFQVPSIDKQLRILQTMLDEDEKKLSERLDQEILRDLTNPEQVYQAIRSKTDDSHARDYFLSMLQHLLLIREEGPAMVHYYQLIDSMVTDIVLDKKLAGAELRLGRSVDRIIAQFNEADRYQVAEEEATEAKAQLLRIKLEKEALEEEISGGHDGLVGSLKEKILHLEQKLAVSRENTSKLQGQIETQKAGYEEQITQLEAQIMELFQMLKQTGKGVDKIIESGSGAMDRKTLIETLDRHLQRSKTISILEGRDKRKKTRDHSEGSEEENDTSPGKPDLKRRKDSSMKKRGKSGRTSETHGGRASQFMDADDADAQEQIQQQLVAGVKIVSTFCRFPATFNGICRCLLGRVSFLEASEVHHAGPTVLCWRAHRCADHTDPAIFQYIG
jgi:cytokinesis protein